MKVIVLNVFGGHSYGYLEISFKAVIIMLSVVAFLLILSKALRKKPIELPKQEFDNFNYDVLQLQGTNENVRKINVSTKIVLYILSAILIYTPFDELLNVSHYFYYSSWGWIF